MSGEVIGFRLFRATTLYSKFSSVQARRRLEDCPLTTTTTKKGRPVQYICDTVLEQAQPYFSFFLCGGGVPPKTPQKNVPASEASPQVHAREQSAAFPRKEQHGWAARCTACRREQGYAAAASAGNDLVGLSLVSAERHDPPDAQHDAHGALDLPHPRGEGAGGVRHAPRPYPEEAACIGMVVMRRIEHPEQKAG